MVAAVATWRRVNATAAPEGVQLAVYVTGDGDPLLLIPGLGARSTVFDPILSLTSHGITVSSPTTPRGIGGVRQRRARSR